ncbi:MAG: cytochrome C oxidase subunit IV family protein [candidate division WOR-3 bacterium]
MKDNHKEHIVTPPVYLAVAIALYILTFITVWAAGIDLGKITNTIIALSIASVKASLVALFFMHLKYESKLLWFMITIPLLLLLILLALPIIDVLTRAGYFGMR